MLKITALKDTTVTINQVIPQIGDPVRGTSPFRERKVTISLKAGESREDASILLGVSGEESPIPHPKEIGEVISLGENLRVERIP